MISLFVQQSPALSALPIVHKKRIESEKDFINSDDSLAKGKYYRGDFHRLEVSMATICQDKVFSVSSKSKDNKVLRQMPTTMGYPYSS